MKDMKEKVFKHIFMPFWPVSWLRDEGRLKCLSKGEGITVTDSEGKTYIDASAGWQFGNVGHGRLEIGDAIRDQIGELAISATEHANVPATKLAEKLATIAPGDLTKVAFCNSGSEGVEMAMKIAKQFHVFNGEPRRHKVITRRGSYAGWTWGGMSVGGANKHMFSMFEPLAPMSVKVMPPYCYRCDFGLSYPACDLQCAREIERVVQNEMPENISAVMGEPISHSCYVSVPPPEYWPMVRSICDRYGILMINDEVITGFGRTGKWFACEHWGAVPDILVFAKGVTSGYIPMGGAISTTRVAEKVESNTRMGLASFPTWGGNPVSSAGALANLGIMEREGLVENSATVGEYLMEGIKDRFSQHPMVGDIRGKGLMVGLELVADKKTKARFGEEVKIVDRVLRKLDEEALLARDFESTIILTPPLCVSKDEIDEIIARLTKVVDGLSKDLGIQ